MPTLICLHQIITNFLSSLIFLERRLWMTFMRLPRNDQENTFVPYRFARKSPSVSFSPRRTPRYVNPLKVSSFWNADHFELPKLQAIDFLEKCLTFSPKKRIDVAEALAHPYLEVGASSLLPFYF